MTATLWGATDARDTDWNVMILDVDPAGAAWRIQDGVARRPLPSGFDKPLLLTPGAITSTTSTCGWLGAEYGLIARKVFQLAPTGRDASNASTNLGQKHAVIAESTTSGEKWRACRDSNAGPPA